MHRDSVTNVVDVCISYLRRKIDAGFDRLLIRTIRGVGYQIGGNRYHSRPPLATGVVMTALAATVRETYSLIH